MKSLSQKTEYGDFQTPLDLAEQVVALLKTRYPKAKLIVEPTCGLGSFVRSAAEVFSESNIEGYEINNNYCEVAQSMIEEIGASRCAIYQSDFFSTNWDTVLERSTGFTLFLGNPPWVTNSKLGTINGLNLPRKNNFQNHNGFDAKTGKSNFDISEWMLIQLLRVIEGKNAAMGFLVKATVARKVFLHAAKNLMKISNYGAYKIDAKKSFGVSVDAVLFVCQGAKNNHDIQLKEYDDLNAKAPSEVLGFRFGRLVSNTDRFDHLAKYYSKEIYHWRSGIKHDLSKVLELTRVDNTLINGFGDEVDVEDTCLYPLLKSSDIAGKARARKERWVLVPQTRIGESTNLIASNSPKTWAYLNKNKSLFAQRKSSIYKEADPFAIFGIGEYSFAPWKVAVSSLYKNIEFQVIGTFQNKPVMLDDTCYLYPCYCKEQACALHRILTSQEARDLMSCLSFQDSKRVVTKDILGSFELNALSKALQIGTEYDWRNPLNIDSLKSAPARIAPQTTYVLDIFDGINIREEENVWLGGSEK